MSSFYNGVLNFNHFSSRGLRGLPGIGFKLDDNNDYDIQNKKMVNVKQGTNSNDVVTKSQLDGEISKIPSLDTTQFVKKTGATMNGDLILQQQPYPIHGNTNKAISYNTARNIFLSKKEGGSMLQSLDMNNHFVTNIKDPVNADHGANKKYVDNQLVKKLDKDTTIDMKDNAITNVKFPVNQKDVATVEYITQRITNSQKNYLKLDGTTSMSGDLNLNNNKIVNFPYIRSAVKNPASLAKPGQAALSGFLAKLTGKMRPGKAWQAWPRPSFLGNLGHKSSAFSAMLVPRPDFLGNLGQKKKKKNKSAFLVTKMLARLSWIFCH